jgi:hypothetical protein
MQLSDATRWTPFLGSAEQACDCLCLRHYDPLYEYGRRLLEKELPKDSIQSVFQQLGQRRI